MSIVKMPGVTL
jgi:hypothetical protein